MAPPTILDKDKRQAIVSIIGMGGSRSTAARFVGCNRATIRRTAKRDPKFAEELRQAEVRQEVYCLKNISTAADDARYWRAAAWVLERLHPQRYDPRRALVVSPDQVAEVLSEFAEAILREVAERALCERILSHIETLIVRLEQPVAGVTNAQ